MVPFGEYVSKCSSGRTSSSRDADEKTAVLKNEGHLLSPQAFKNPLTPGSHASSLAEDFRAR